MFLINLEKENAMECIYANEEFGTRICKLTATPVTREDCAKCKEQAYKIWNMPLKKESDDNDN